MAFCLFAFQACDPIDYKLKVKNETRFPFYVIHSFAPHIGLVDSTVAEPYNGEAIQPHDTYTIMGNYVTWETEIGNTSADKRLRLFICHRDTVFKHSWKTIIDELKFYKVYTLSVADLQKMNWVVTVK